MAIRQKLPRFEAQESRWEHSGLFAASDWRYDALVDYLKLSPSFKLVCEWAEKALIQYLKMRQKIGVS